MNSIRWLLLISVSVVMAACARVPTEAVTLSETIGKDLVATRTAHTALVQRYFDSIRANINSFVDSTYRPFIVRTTMEELKLIKDIQDAAAGRHELGLDALDVMQIYVEEVMRRIEAFRGEMLAPINAQEDTLMTDLERSYNTMINANATVTAHLRSLSAVRDAQQQALAQLGLDEGLRERITGQTTNLAGAINELLAKSRANGAELDKLPGQVDALVSKNRSTK